MADVKAHVQDAPWPQAVFSYSSEDKASYYDGRLFGIWYKEYQHHLCAFGEVQHLFRERMLSSRQIPHSGRVKNTFYFHEFYMGTQYLKAGYDVLFYARKVEDSECYEIASELLGGGDAAQFIFPNSEEGGRAPDLLVFDRCTKRVRFVECKGKYEPFTKKQIGRFIEIESYLKRTSTASALFDPLYEHNLFPPVSEGQWIHIARLRPKSPNASPIWSKAATTR